MLEVEMVSIEIDALEVIDSVFIVFGVPVDIAEPCSYEIEGEELGWNDP